MAKRTNTDSATENPSNWWPTPSAAVVPLLEPLRDDVMASRGRFIEPCAGDGALVDVLVFNNFECAVAFDTAPRRDDIRKGNAARITIHSRVIPFVTNPPWAQHLLEPILANLVGKAPVWLLLPLDMATNLWTNPYMRHVNKLVPLGRVSWMNNGRAGMENSAWFRFDLRRHDFITIRHPK